MIGQNNSFDRFAKEYETLVRNSIFNKLVWGTSPDDYKQFVKSSLDRCVGTILDVGCGGLVQTADEYCRINNQIVLFDYSPTMLKIGQKRIAKNTSEKQTRIQFIEGSVWGLPFEKGSFDNIISFGFLHLFDNKSECIDKIFQVLKSGGYFHFSSLTTERYFSRICIRFMQNRKILGNVLSAADTVQLFEEYTSELSYYTKGSMIFISGKIK